MRDEHKGNSASRTIGIEPYHRSEFVLQRIPTWYSFHFETAEGFIIKMRRSIHGDVTSARRRSGSGSWRFDLSDRGQSLGRFCGDFRVRRSRPEQGADRAQPWTLTKRPSTASKAYWPGTVDGKRSDLGPGQVLCTSGAAWSTVLRQRLRSRRAKMLPLSSAPASLVRTTSAKSPPWSRLGRAVHPTPPRSPKSCAATDLRQCRKADDGRHSTRVYTRFQGRADEVGESPLFYCSNPDWVRGGK